MFILHLSINIYIKYKYFYIKYIILNIYIKMCIWRESLIAFIYDHIKMYAFIHFANIF